MGLDNMVNGIVDSRVVAIAPIVMDLLNFEAGLLHMFRSYGLDICI